MLFNFFKKKRMQEAIKTESSQNRSLVTSLLKDKNIRLLIVSDTHSTLNRQEIEILKEQNFDACLLLGDISPIELNTIMHELSPNKVYGILGNHDNRSVLEKLEINEIHKKQVEINGVTIAGFGGSIKYKESDCLMYTDEQSVEELAELPPCDIFVTHDSAKNVYAKSDKAHSGLQGITEYIQKNNVKLHIHGHIHTKDVMMLDNGTLSICNYRASIVSVIDGAIDIQSLF